MTPTQEKAITQSLDILKVGFFECPKHFYEYFLHNDDWALLMAAAGLNDVTTPPPVVALAVLRNAVLREGLFAGMTDFRPPTHHCSFLGEQIRRGERTIDLEPCKEGHERCPYANFENLQGSGRPTVDHLLPQRAGDAPNVIVPPGLTLSE
jgi:hypothetical protein